MAVEKRKHKTPSGGVSSEMYFLDDDNNEAKKEEATTIIIRELDGKGNLINKTYAYV